MPKPRRSRLLRLVLRLFPKEFRLTYARDMELDFREQQRDAARTQGRRGVFRLWLATLLGTLKTAPGEHLRVLAGDSRYALRRFRKQPGLALVAVLTIAIGIGASTAVFSLVDRVLLRPLPYDDPERLVHLRPLLDGEESMSGPIYIDLTHEVGVFDGIFSMAGLGSTTIAGAEGPERVKRLVVSANYFDVLGTEPMLGRTFAPRDVLYLPTEVMRTAPPEERPIGPVVISHSLWQRRFGGELDAVGSQLEIDGRPFEIIGVLPETFRVLMPRLMNLDAKRDLWYLSNWDPATFPREVHYLEAIGRLGHEVTLAQAQAAVDVFCARQRERYPELRDLDYRIRVEPLHRQVVGHTSQALWTLFGAVTFVMLIACANVASIMLAGSATRQGELGMRVALGATRERLVRQLMTESVMVALAGAVLGLGLADLGLDVLEAVRPDGLQRFEAASVDGRMLTFAVLGTAISAILFGTLPSLRYSRPRLEHALTNGRNPLGGLLRRRGRGLIVAAEIALSFVLLAGTGLLVRSLAAQIAQDPGFEPAGVVTGYVHLPRGYSDREDRIGLYREMSDRLAEIPGVDSAAFTSNLPFDAGGGHAPIAVEPDLEEQLVWDARITPGYFQTLGIPLREGRLPTWSDLADPDRPFALVDERLAARLWPEESAVGQRIRVPRLSFAGGDDVPNEYFWADVLGVVGHIHDDSLTEPGPETVYLGLHFTPTNSPILTLEASIPASRLEPAVRDTLRKIDDHLAAAGFRDMNAWVGDATADLRFTLGLLSLFGAIGLLLAAVGLYALLAHAVRRGTGEIGLRMALGAEPAGVLQMVLSQGLRLVVWGLIAGLVGALVLGRVLGGQLHGVTAHDPAILGLAVVVLVLAAVVACGVPALRALRVDPLVALRTE